MYDYHFSNFGRPSFPDDLCKDLAWRHPPFWKKTWPPCKKIKCQCTTFILATLVHLPSLMICAKIQPQGILSFGEEDLLKVFTILVNGPWQF